MNRPAAVRCVFLAASDWIYGITVSCEGGIETGRHVGQDSDEGWLFTMQPSRRTRERGAERGEGTARRRACMSCVTQRVILAPISIQEREVGFPLYQLYRLDDENSFPVLQHGHAPPTAQRQHGTIRLAFCVCVGWHPDVRVRGRGRGSVSVLCVFM